VQSDTKTFNLNQETLLKGESKTFQTLTII